MVAKGLASSRRRRTGHAPNLAGRYGADGFKGLRDQWPQVFKCVARSRQHHDPERPVAKVLLVLKIAVTCHEDLEAGGFGLRE